MPLDFDDAEANAGKLIAEWIRARGDGNRPADRLLGQASRELKQLLEKDGYPYDAVRVGFAEWARRNLHPSAIASVVDELRQGGRKSAPKASTTDERVGGFLAIADRIDAAEGRVAQTTSREIA